MGFFKLFLSFGFRGGGGCKGGLERGWGWGRVGEGAGEGLWLGRGLGKGWGRVGEGLAFCTSKTPPEKPVTAL